MTLAYTFWHRPRDPAQAPEYEADLDRFHQRLAAQPPAGFLGSRSLRVPDLPWLAGGGYEDWYLVEGFGSLDALSTAAVDSSRAGSHDRLAAAVLDGAGGLYRLVDGTAFAPAGWFGWFGKQAGVPYSRLLGELREHVKEGTLGAVWQRQLVLGPAPEWRLEAPAPVRPSGVDLSAEGPIVRSGWRA